MLFARFTNCTEFRMGSSFMCELILTGDWKPDLPDRPWHDRKAASPDGSLLALVSWDLRESDVGFRIVVLDQSKRQVIESPRIQGCCLAIRWENGGFHWWSSVDPSEGTYIVE